MNPEESYRLSRVQTEGWHAAQEFSSDRLDSLGTTEIQTLSPYKSDPERARWMTGFRSALKV